MVLLEKLILILYGVIVGLVLGAPLQDHVTTQSILIGRETSGRSRRETADYTETKAMAIMVQEVMESCYEKYCESKHEELDVVMNFGGKGEALDTCNTFGQLIIANNPMPTPTAVDTSKEITQEELRLVVRASQQVNVTLSGLLRQSEESLLLAGACVPSSPELPGPHGPCEMKCDSLRQSLGEMLCHVSSQVLPSLGGFLGAAQKQIPMAESDEGFLEVVIDPATYQHNMSHLGYANLAYLYYAHAQLLTNKHVFEKIAA